VVMCGVNSSGSGQELLASSCEHSSELLGPKEGEELPD
jgi:hypothetical protein